MFVVVILCYPLSFAINAETLDRIAWESGPIQITGAVLFLVASAGFFALFLRSSDSENSFFGRRTKRNIFLGLLAVVLFVCCGEEASWGQHLFGFETPQVLSGLNAQNETNLHNLWFFHQWRPDGSEKSFFGLLLNMNRLFSIFWLTFFVVVPISEAMSQQTRRALLYAGIPIPPIWVGCLFLVSFISYKTTAALTADPIRGFPLDELKETTYAAVFAFFAVYSLATNRRVSNACARQNEQRGEWPDDGTNPELIG